MAYGRYTASNAAMLLIDHQIGTIEWMHSAPKDEVIRARSGLGNREIRHHTGILMLQDMAMGHQAHGLGGDLCIPLIQSDAEHPTFRCDGPKWTSLIESAIRHLADYAQSAIDRHRLVA